MSLRVWLPAATGPLVLVAHGSRDPRAARANAALAAAVRRARPGTPVRLSFLDHAGPRPADVLLELEASGAARATLVPLLLTSAYHGRVDIPAALMDARAAGLRMPVALADVLGPVAGVPDPLLLAALHRRLLAATAAAGVWSPDAAPLDGVVLAAAGTRDAAARDTVETVARSLSVELGGVPCQVAYASAAAPTGDEAVAALRARGARHIAVSSYFLAPGLLHEAVVTAARSAGATILAEPLGGAPELARLVVARTATAREPVCDLAHAA
ncbi:CbiX/SirB N-terminal domain-containing protein [Asanoa sp. WMMD1127]|uniref:sirohydrochlorin chelatase n=1 Tax=Asanoa sp. WMMD1127 TaxID=3016107 RepID=UPI002415E14C|nr:CbiX/SirB N-terminal domain-containing protein [Asanoa sp. WMMD1127]MDG4823054.1 CbiX/SirB N-terminal domain-containing protein [Asanoa sp. WMMD1127]